MYLKQVLVMVFDFINVRSDSLFTWHMLEAMCHAKGLLLVSPTGSG